jgi:nicotinamide mononucleotide transporter
MVQSITEWLLVNKIELLGAILGVIYIRFSIKQNIFIWPTGILTSVLYIIVFFNSSLYAAMGLQFYYVVISIYGWYHWLRGKKADYISLLPIQRVKKKMWIRIGLVSIFLFFLIRFILIKFSDSDVPNLDSLTTSLSIIATWMLARKYIENWVIWIFVDFVSIGLYIYKSLWPTVLLFVVYTVLAFFGYFEWKKDLKEKN